LGTAVISLICMALLVFAGMTMSNDFISSWDSTTDTFSDMSDGHLEVLQTDIATLSATVDVGRENLEVALINRGGTTIADFEQWDVIVQYYDNQGNYYTTWLPYVSGTPVNNQWTVEGIYVDAGTETAELLEAGILNPGEEMIIWANISPNAGTKTTNLVIIDTPSGVTASIHFQS